MSEERKMILQMLADGKISAGEAETLLSAIEEGERTARETVVEGAQRTDRTGDGLQSLGRLIESAVGDAFRAVDETFRSLEGRLKHDEARQEQIRRRVEDRIRRSTEHALERALEAEERVTRAAERAARRMEEPAVRAEGRTSKSTFFKMGVHIDKVTVQREESLAIEGGPGDTVRLNNRVGDLTVEYTNGSQIELVAVKTVWGADEADAGERADATRIRPVRRGSDVTIEIDRPAISAVGVLHVKDTRIDITLRVPRQTRLDLATKVGDIKVVADEQIPAWRLAAKVGDIELVLPPGAGFHYELETRVGSIRMQLGEGDHDQSFINPLRESQVTGTLGGGGGHIVAKAATGDIHLHH